MVCRLCEFEERGERADAGHEHDAEADSDAKREIIQLGVEVLAQRLDVRFRNQLRHDELPCCFGVSVRLLLGHAMFSQMPSIAQGVEGVHHVPLLFGVSVEMIPRVFEGN